jgi:16S rRNA (guanine527-N7)-methyltransferase
VDELTGILTEGAAAMALPLTSAQIEKLMAFLRLLQKWNRVYNLTAIDKPVGMARLHLLDSLAVLPYLGGERVLDVGTGAGLPGIPLAIAAPGKSFVLLDSNSKKTRFVRQAAIELGLRNVEVVHERIERFDPAQDFDVILSRAFASLSDMVQQTRRLLKPGGILLAQKGRFPSEEIAALTGVTAESHPVAVPGVAAERHFIQISLNN